jgi:hypothetical protein
MPFFMAKYVVIPVVKTITDIELTGIKIAAINGDSIP